MVTKYYKYDVTTNEEIYNEASVFRKVKLEEGEFIAHFDDKTDGPMNLYRFGHCACIFFEKGQVSITGCSEDVIFAGRCLLERALSKPSPKPKFKLEEVKGS